MSCYKKRFIGGVMQFEFAQERIGQVAIGMTLGDVERVLGNRGQFIPRSGEEMYGFFDNNLQISVGGDGLVRFVEVFAPAALVFLGKNIIGMRLSAFVKLLPPRAEVFTIAGSDGITSYNPNIVVGELSGRITSAGTFKDDYYDGLIDRQPRGRDRAP